MDEDAEFRIRSWLKRNRIELVELLSLSLAEWIVGRLITPLPFIAAVVAPALEALVPAGRKGDSGAGAAALRSRMPRRLALAGATCAAWIYYWDLPAKCLFLGPTWIAVAWVLHMNWPAFPGKARELLLWSARHVRLSSRAQAVFRLGHAQ